MKMIADVAEFMVKLELTYDGPPRDLPSDLARQRVDHLHEELQEYVEATVRGDLEAQFDALLDLVYVSIGTLYLHGFPADDGWRRVHAANMMKKLERSVSVDGLPRKQGVVKPIGWRPPDLSDLVRPDYLGNACCDDGRSYTQTGGHPHDHPGPCSRSRSHQMRRDPSRSPGW